MSKPDMENIYRQKFEDFEPELPNDRWPDIRAKLDREKKHRFFIIIFLFGALAAGCISLLLVPESNKNLSVGKTTEKSAAGFEEESKKTITTTNEKEVNTGISSNQTVFPSPEGQKIIISSYSSAPTNGAHQLQASGPEAVNNSGSPTNNSPEEVLNNIPSPENENLPSISTDTTPTIPGPIVIAGPTAPIITNPVKTEENKNNSGKSHTWDFGFGFNSSYSMFRVRMPSDIGSYPNVTQDMVDKNYKLRKGIEKGGFSFSQSISATYHVTSNWSLTTGITMMQTTQIFKFNMINANDRISGPEEYGSSATASYQFANDSIAFGGGTTRYNKYYGREIPLFVNYQSPINKKIAFVGSFGLSYRYLASGSIYLPDVDNVGLIYLSNKDLFPGFKGTFTLHAAAGIRWNISEYVHLQVLPTYQHSLQSNIQFQHLVQQYQRQAGVQFRLNRTITFTK